MEFTLTLQQQKLTHWPEPKHTMLPKMFGGWLIISLSLLGNPKPPEIITTSNFSLIPSIQPILHQSANSMKLQENLIFSHGFQSATDLPRL